MRRMEFAEGLGVSVDTVRRLERRGVIRPGRDWNNQRRFNAEDLARARADLFPEDSERGRKAPGRSGRVADAGRER